MSAGNETSKCNAFSLVGVCSSRGVCDESISSCICDSGWSSIGDFSSVYGAHCSINVIAIRILWIPALIASPFLFYFSFHLLYIKIKSAKMKKRSDLLSDLSILVTILTLATALLCGIVSLLKVIDPERFSIGYNLGASVIFYLLFTTALCTGYLYTKLLANFILGFLRVISPGSKFSIKNKKMFVNKLFLFGCMLSPIFYFATVANVLFPNNDYAFAVIFLAYGLIIAFFLAASIFHFLRMIEHEIEKHLKGSDEMNLKIENKLDPLVLFKSNIRKSKNLAFILGLNVVLFYAIMLSLDILVVNTSYLWPNISLAIIMFFTFMIRSMKNNSSAGQSSGQNNPRESKKNLEVVPIKQTTDDQETSPKITSPTSEVERNP